MPYFPRKYANPLKVYYGIGITLKTLWAETQVLVVSEDRKFGMFPAVNAKSIFRSSLTVQWRIVLGRDN